MRLEERIKQCKKCEDEFMNSNEWAIVCLNGKLYGPCESEYCHGACEYEGECRCKCHEEAVPTEGEKK